MNQRLKKLALSNSKINRLIASVLLIYLAISTIFIWTLDLLKEQSIFGLTISSQLVAFSMLLYLYLTADTNDPSRYRLFLGAAFILFLLFMMAFFP